MNYTLIPNQQGRGYKRKKMVSITKLTFGFLAQFREKHKVRDYIELYSNDEGFLCFKFIEQPNGTSYKVTNGVSGAYFLRLPGVLRNGVAPLGSYDVEEKDGYFVTDCKLNLE